MSIKNNCSKKLNTQKPNNPIIHGQLKHEEIFNIHNYKGNVNKNDIDIPSFVTQNGFHQGNKPYQMTMTVDVCVEPFYIVDGDVI
jgi:hypothetical protein